MASSSDDKSQPAPTILLAKKPRDATAAVQEETLVGHTKIVCTAAETLGDMLAEYVKVAGDVPEEGIKLWKEALWLSAWMHDWGKANDHFQAMLLNGGMQRQSIRHELLGVFLMESLSDWLESVWSKYPGWVKAAVVFAVAGHHLKYPDPYASLREGTSVTAFKGHNDFEALLSIGAKRYSLCSTRQCKNETYGLLSSDSLPKYLKRLPRLFDFDFTDTEKYLIASVKTALMAADLAGSALPSYTKEVAMWVRDRLGQTIEAQQLEAVVKAKIGGRAMLPFQQEAAQTDDNTVLIEAGCGSGKTIAAYLWAARHIKGRRLFFCYPTTGTASEGFSGYLHDPDFDAILVHSRAQIDYRLLENMPSPGHEESELRESRLEALETWPAPVTVCTAHTVLGTLENVRRGIYAWPSFVRAVFIFDEVHAFSNRLFSYLLRFLKDFPGVPVLMMTATLPKERRSAIEEVCRGRGGVLTIHGPAEREAAMRYTLEDRATDVASVWDTVMGVYKRGGKILWVCNTVKGAMEVFDQAESLGLKPEAYHSRYRYCDRLKRQRTVIDGFRSPESMFAITTQVAEMSLDLSADLLVTEYAPIAAMIQRMGRLNRFDTIPESTCPAIFVRPKKAAPYEEEEVALATRWIARLADGKPKSQGDLAEAFLRIDEQNTTVLPIERCEWLDGLWYSQRDQRAIEEAGYTVEVVRTEDLGHGDLAEFVIPMPIPPDDSWREWRKVGRYFIVPQGRINYDERRGGNWNHR